MLSDVFPPPTITFVGGVSNSAFIQIYKSYKYHIAIFYSDLFDLIEIKRNFMNVDSINNAHNYVLNNDNRIHVEMGNVGYATDRSSVLHTDGLT